jgi:hypothetical protein
MSAVSREAFQRELGQARAFARGNRVTGVASFRCEDRICPVEVVQVAFAEVRGVSKAMQNPLKCPRCSVEMSYVGLERHR